MVENRFPSGGHNWDRIYTVEVHVLLVHNDSNFLSTVSKLMRGSKYISGLCQVKTANLGYEALSILSEKDHGIDIVIANVDLPDMDGFKLLNETVKMKLTTVLMSLTGEDDDELAAKALRNNAFRFLKKPITTEALQYVLKHAEREKLKKHAQLPLFSYGGVNEPPLVFLDLTEEPPLYQEEEVVDTKNDKGKAIADPWKYKKKEVLVIKNYDDTSGMFMGSAFRSVRKRSTPANQKNADEGCSSHPVSK